VVGVFTPENSDPPLHLYDHELEEGGTGFPTRLDLSPDSPALAAGPIETDQKPSKKTADGAPIYPDGPVRLRLPIEVKPGTPRDAKITVLVTYMACTDKSCRLPVIRQPVVLSLDGEGGALGEQAAAAVPSDTKAFARLVADEVTRQLDERAHDAIRWRRPATVKDVEALVAAAHAEGKPALLDFTGPSCVNCQVMEKTVFTHSTVQRAWNGGVPLKLNTDPPNDELARWQQERFGTQNRPLYVFLGPGGKEERWSETFALSDAAAMERFVAFLGGGAGSHTGSGSGVFEFLLLALLGGLFTLVMPCTYPMIPLTVNVFARQQAQGRRLVPLAAFYALGIVASFTGLGIAITGIFGSSLASVSGSPWTNFVIAVLFVVLGLSLLDVFFLRLPGGVTNAIGGAKAGYAGALVMGLTFAITAFTCTAPFAGTILAEGALTGSWGTAAAGMIVYSSAIALPFFVLAVSPTVMSRMPKAHAWMHEFKVVGGLVEIGAALKFIVIADVAWNWGLFGRGVVVSLWAALALVIAFYLAGRLRLEGDARIEHLAPQRLLLVLAFLGLGVWLVHGLAGGNLGIVESFFPNDPAPTRYL
jgi:thiol:disulfide interchange protein